MYYTIFGKKENTIERFKKIIEKYNKDETVSCNEEVAMEREVDAFDDMFVNEEESLTVSVDVDLQRLNPVESFDEFKSDEFIV